MKATKSERLVRYSRPVRGNQRNYGWPVSFIEDNGYVTISQAKHSGTVDETVLLSPAQCRALVTFVEEGQ